jgi:hypothetical protein
MVIGETVTYSGSAFNGSSQVSNTCVNWSWTVFPEDAATITLINDTAIVTWLKEGSHILTLKAYNTETTIDVLASKIVTVDPLCTNGIYVDTGVIKCGALFNTEYGLTLDVCKEYKQQKDECANVYQYLQIGVNDTCPTCAICNPDGTFIRYDYVGCIICEDPAGYTYTQTGFQEIVSDGNCGYRNGVYTAPTCGSDVTVQNC